VDAVVERTGAFGLALRAPLLPYQEIGVRRLLEAPGVLLADEMGLGKTIQAIGALRLPFSASPGGHALIVVPSGLVLQWRRQLRDWAPELSLATCVGPAEDRRRRWGADGIAARRRRRAEPDDGVRGVPFRSLVEPGGWRRRPRTGRTGSASAAACTCSAT
jgi:SNF2 family DNA or RNA helicase